MNHDSHDLKDYQDGYPGSKSIEMYTAKPTMILMIKGLSGLEVILKIDQANPANRMNHGPTY